MPPLAGLEEYLGRIELGGQPDPDLALVHRAHATTIPFENLDSYAGRPVSLEPGVLEDKIVTRRRGGYCFEHNLLLAGALESLGGRTVEPMLARVRVIPEGQPRALNHLLLRVTERDGSCWLADVGFGGGGLLDPMPFEVGVENDQSGWRYRLAEDPDGPELILQVFQDGAWTDLYGFVPEPAQRVDIEVNNWYTSTHPTSSFVTGIMIGRRQAGRCLSFFAGEPGAAGMLVERAVGAESSTTLVELHAVPALLAERFGLPGVAVDAAGRLALR